MMCNPNRNKSLTNELSNVKDYIDNFTHRYKEEYGFNLNRDIYVDDIRIRAIGRATTNSLEKQDALIRERSNGKLEPINVSKILFFLINNDLF